MKLLKENEEKLFVTVEATKEFFKEQETADVWKDCRTAELTAFPVPGLNTVWHTPEQIKLDCGFPQDVSCETVDDCFQNTKVGINVPLDKKVPYPLSSTGFSSAMMRAGFEASSILRDTDEKRRHEEMPPSEKTTILNLGLSRMKDKAKVLIRDEMVRAVLSGDESDYKVLPSSELMQELEEGLKVTYPNLTFHHGVVSHERMEVNYLLKDEKLKERILQALKTPSAERYGEPSVKLTSSDVGLGGANIYPVLFDGKKSMLLGEKLSLCHLGASIEQFRENVQQVNSWFKDQEKHLQEMANTAVKHPGGCLRAMAKAAGLPKKAVMEQSYDFETRFGAGRYYQSDVYSELYEILYAYAETTKMPAAKQLSLAENICRKSMFFEKYDVEFAWED